jgi:hypothetical protein
MLNDLYGWFADPRRHQAALNQNQLCHTLGIHSVLDLVLPSQGFHAGLKLRQSLVGWQDFERNMGFGRPRSVIADLFDPSIKVGPRPSCRSNMNLLKPKPDSQ